MARDNLQFDKFLRLRREQNYFFQPSQLTKNHSREKQTTRRDRQQRMERRKVDWDNECKQIEQKGPMIPFDESDLKVKNLIYLILGSEGSMTYHQRNPRTKIERCTTNELVHELTLTFIRPRNTTFDQFQCFKAMQQPNESLETFYSRLRELGSHCRFEN